MTKVAIFETDHAFAVELRAELSRFGCTVQVFTDGTSGLAAAKAHPPDLILVSAELPPVNGFSTCNKLKKNARLQAVPVILMSSESSPEMFDQHRRLPSRADDYIHKPISFADFLPHIQELIALENPHGILDEDTGMVMDEEVLLIQDAVLEEARDNAEGASERRATLELDIGDENRKPLEHRRPRARRDDEEDEELVTVVGERPHVPDHLLEQFRRARAAATNVGEPPSSDSNPVSSVRGAPVSARPSSPSRPSSEPRPSTPPGTWSTPAPALQAPPADLQRAKNALQAALAQLNQARKDAASLTEQLAVARREQGTDVVRLKKDVDQTKQKLTTLLAVSEAHEREALDLRERVQARDKELLETREALAAKERELLATKDEHIQLERAVAAERERKTSLETDKSAANARVEALLADKALADKRAEDFKNGARKIAEQLNQRARELHEANESHRTTVEQLKREQQAALAEAETKHRDELARVETTHREQLERTRAAEQDKASKTKLATQAKIETAQLHAKEQIERAQKTANEKVARIEQQHADHIAKLEATHAKALAELRAAQQSAQNQGSEAHQKERDALREQLEAANLEAAELRKLADDAKETIDEALSEQQAENEQHERALAQLAATHEQAQAQAAEERRLELEQLVEKHRTERTALEALLSDQAAKLAALREEHEQALVELQRENAEALQKAGYDYQEKVLQKEKSFATLKEQLDNELTDANQEIQELRVGQARLSDATELERREYDDSMATLQAERDDFAAQVKRLEDDGARMADALAQIEQKLERARVRWGEDRAELKQLKNTLAGLVRSLDETMVKDLD